MVLLDAAEESGLEVMLKRWQVLVGDDIVVDPDSTQQGADVIARASLFNPNHPITKALQARA